MSSNTLDELGRAVLEAIADGEPTVEAIERQVEASGVDPEASGVDLEAPGDESAASREAIDRRLSQLVDNALVREGDGGYALTENGQRLLAATPIGARDDRIDTPPAVEAAIEDLSLRADEADAVRHAFSFLRYWGEATTAEIVDAAYSEAPAGYDAAERWWSECVGDALAGLPDVRRSGGESSADGEDPERWRYEGESVVERPPDRDGREIGAERSDPSSFGSVRHGIERLTATDDERAAARAAFATLADRGRASGADLAERVYDDHPARFDSPTDWTTWLADVFDALPGIEREAGADEAAFAYDPSPGDRSMSR